MSGDLYVNSDGLLSIAQASFDNTEAFQKLEKVIELCNKSIEDEILAVKSQEVELYTIYNVDETQISDVVFDHKEDITENQIAPFSTAHGCSYPAKNIISLCETNYQDIENYYNSMLNLSLINSSLNPLVATTGYWVGKVREEGDWDYKAQPGYSPYNKTFCNYYNGRYCHYASEYLGNFNYDHTGSFLFSLDVLHTGSFAASGFNDIDKTTDWPAIDDGYYTKLGRTH